MDIYKIVDDYILEHREKWIAQAKELQTMPEYGFCEHRTSAYVQASWDALGIGPVANPAVTARIARIPGRDHKANVALLGELDGVYSPENPTADPETGVSHACGHHAQINALLAAAEAIQATGVMQELDGDLTLIAVPAEEVTPSHIIDQLQAEGKISSFCGKHELLKLGYFDDVDVLMGTHALDVDGEKPEMVMVNSSCHGLKEISFFFKGKAAHSTVCPEKGINALNAVVLAINGIQCMRENLNPNDEVRIAYAIPEGGRDVGTVVDKAELKVAIATKTDASLIDCYERIVTIAKSAAAASGCGFSMEDSLAYAPYIVDNNLLDCIEENATALTGVETKTRPHNYFSNDLGDVSQILPTAQVVFGGFAGDLHSAGFYIDDEENAYVLPARVMARTILNLLDNGCEKALFIKENFKKRV